jgi:hypothetical protein
MDRLAVLVNPKATSPPVGLFVGEVTANCVRRDPDCRARSIGILISSHTLPLFQLSIWLRAGHNTAGAARPTFSYGLISEASLSSGHAKKSAFWMRNSLWLCMALCDRSNANIGSGCVFGDRVFIVTAFAYRVAPASGMLIFGMAE